MDIERQLRGRARTRLRLARENGYLDARIREWRVVLQIYSLWCWRLKLPLVWIERCSRYSRYGRVHLDLYTTGGVLSARAIAGLEKCSRASPYDAHWDRVPLGDLYRVAAAAMRMATRPGNTQPNRQLGSKLILIDLSRTA